MKLRRAVTPLILISAAGIALAACSALSRGPVGNKAVPQPAKAVDLGRYVGLWYEIGRYDTWFERGCEAVTAEYRRREDGAIDVINTCRKGGPTGPIKVARGRAKVVADSANAKLKVSFFGPFFGDYWVLDHADDYAWSIVGEPSGRYLWLLARTQHPAEQVQRSIYERAHSLGYDLALLRPTRHP
jgi:apolipoprotein D and lipocalin family protein